MTWIQRTLAPLPPRLRRWVVCVGVLGFVAVGGSIATGAAPPPLLASIAAVGLVAATRTAKLRIRIGSERFEFGWGELALVVVFALLAPAWVAPAVLLGVLVGQVLTRAPLLKAIYNAAAHGAAAAASAAIIAVGTRDGVIPLTSDAAVAVCLAVVCYVALTNLFSAGAVAAASTSPLRTVVTRGLWVTALMMLGNTAVGLLILAVGFVDVRWLIVVPPLLWLLGEAYNARLRASEERRAWQELAAATHQLNLLDQCEVVKAAVRGAQRLFAPDDVEVITDSGRGLAASGGEVSEQDGTKADPNGGETVVRELSVGGERVGELRLKFYDKVSLNDREQLALSAFADALGAALQNASTHATLREMAVRKSYEASHDPLTGLANRTRLLEHGESALRSLADSGRSAHVALLLLDLNHFKDVNDALGHAAGDQLLQATAERLTAAIEPDELLARLGGDEFALVVTAMPETGSPEEHAASRARQLVNALSTPTDVAGVALAVEASVGVVTVPAGTCDMTELLRRADVAMYQAKRSGRVIASYDGSRDGASADRLALVAELREALSVDDQLVIELQPAVDLVSGAPVGAEALVRWHHPRRGLLSPAEFIGAVEQSELVGPFTRYVVDRALALAASWAEEGLDVPVAVNLSARSLLDRRLPTEIAELLGRHRVAPERLVLEITETVMMTELDVIDDVLGNLREIGAQLAVDDFGTGYSSLTFLARFPVHEVKVDRAFVTRMIDSPEARAIVRSTVELARSLDMRVVAEGVETAEQRNALAEMGCHAAQGYHFFPPIPADKATNVLWTLQRSAEARGAQVIRLSRGQGARAE